MILQPSTHSPSISIWLAFRVSIHFEGQMRKISAFAFHLFPMHMILNYGVKHTRCGRKLTVALKADIYMKGYMHLLEVPGD